MSRTMVVSTPIQIKRTGSTLLTPSKRVRRNAAPVKVEAKQPSHKEIFAWTLTAEATASCLVRDVFEAKESEGGQDFYWLGRVPCRNVRLVGMVVGVSVYDNRFVYAVDDGTAVIDCSQRVTAPVQKVPEKTLPTRPLSPPPPLRLAVYVGDFIRATGKIARKHEERQIVVDRIEKCASANEELTHCLEVMNLHKTHYSLPEPFVVPRVKVALKGPSTPIHGTNLGKQTSSIAQQSSPVSSVASSPMKSEYSPASPHKLRHPSRLHSAELIPNTFRIYVKHFMDNDSRCPSIDPCCSMGSSSSIPGVPSGLTASVRAYSNNATPRPTRTKGFLNSTPRPRIEPISFACASTNKSGLASSYESEGDEDGLRGYTLSYLRRVPELFLLAKWVLKQEARIARKKLKDTGTVGKSKSVPKITEKPRLRVAEKRLFHQAINQLYQEGSIIMWDGPIRSHADVRNASHLWKASAGSASYDLTTSSSIFGHSKVGVTFDLDDDAELSDPPPNEESYIPLKTPYLADYLEKTLPKVKAAMEAATKLHKPYSGVTNEALLAHLRRDDRWQFIRPDSIDEALLFLKEDGRVWCPRKGQWDLTL